MGSRRDKEARILAHLALPDRFEIVVPPGSAALQIDPARLASATTIVASVTGTEAAKAHDLLRAIGPRLTASAVVILVLNGMTPALMQGGLQSLVETAEREGYALIDIVGGADAALVALRYTATLDIDEMTAWISHKGIEVGLAFPVARRFGAAERDRPVAPGVRNRSRARSTRIGRGRPASADRPSPEGTDGRAVRDASRVRRAPATRSP